MVDGSDGNASPFLPMFETFRAQLDEHHDRRERVIKASRDVTAASKKIGTPRPCFCNVEPKTEIKRSVRSLGRQLPPHVVNGNKQYYDTIAAQLASVSKDLQGINSFRYARQISGGCQEYIEAATFETYLTTATLLSYDEANEKLRNLDADGLGVSLSGDDYILGVYDMTGELMRFAITTMATSGGIPTIGLPDETMDEGDASSRRNLLTDMRSLRSELESLEVGSGPFAKEAEKKMQVMQSSVEKVEKALYGLVVRGAERPKGWMPDAEVGRTAEVDG